MKLKYTAVLIATAIASTSAMAGGFDGPFVQGGLGMSRMQTKVDETWDGGGQGGKNSKTAFIGQIAAGYSKSFDKFNLAGSLYMRSNQKSGDVVMYDDAPYWDRIRVKTKNTWGFTVEPGYNINPNALVYGKLGLSQTKGRMNYDYFIDGNLDLSEPTTSKTHTGFSYGMGFKYKFTPTIYGMAEMMQTDYRRKAYIDTDYGWAVKAKPSTFTALVGLGYKF